MIATIYKGQKVMIHVDCVSQEKPFITNVEIDGTDITDFLLEMDFPMEKLLQEVKMLISKHD